MKTPLTPTARALVQFLESMLITACIAGLLSIEPLIAGTGSIDWQVAATTFGLAVFFSLAHSIAAYFKPSQPDLSAAVSAVVDELEAHTKPVSSSPTMPTVQPMLTGYPNVPMNTQQPATPIVAPAQGSVWAPLQGGDVSMQNTASQPAYVPPK